MQQTQATVADTSEKAEISIIEASSGASFFVTGVKKNEALKDQLKKMGGHYNAHARGYNFPARDLDRVCKELGVSKSINLVDPRSIIEVEFTQKFQWKGDMAQAEAKLKEIGLTKKSGRNNSWSGDLSRAGVFLNAFGIAVAPTQ